jgi:alkyldihydroxyacetonephosphate synthase
MEEADRVAEELGKIIPGRVVRDVKEYLRDWWPIFRISSEEEGRALVALKPVNIEEVGKVVKYATTSKIPISCRGGGSSVTGASVPSGGIVVDMSAMNRVLDVDETNRTIVVESGAKLSDVESKLNQRGFTLGQFPQSFELATIGGYISTMGTGQNSTRYGGIEDSVLRLQVALPDGEVIWTRWRDVPRSSVGPDLSRLFIGSEGAFGIILAAELRIQRVAEHTWKAAALFENFASAVSVVKKLMDLDVQPAVCRVYNEVESAFQFGNTKTTALLVYSFSSSRVMEAVTSEVLELLGSDGTLGEPSLVNMWLGKRFAFREQIESIRGMGYTFDTAEIASNWGRLLDLYEDVVTELGGLDGVAAVGAHLSHLYHQGACIYFTLVFKPVKELYWTLWNTMSRITEKHDATISHHHGVGILKAQFARKEIPSELLRLLKNAIDPERIMNPNKLI